MWELYIHFALLLLNVLVWTVRYIHFGRELRLLGFALLVTLLFEACAAYLMLHSIMNLHLYHLLTPIQYALYALIFYEALNSRKQKRAILLSIPLFALVSFLMTLYLQGVTEFNSYALSIKNVLIILWVLYYYQDVFTGLKISRLNMEPMFWVSTGLFFYSLGSFFVYGLMNHLLKHSYELALPLYYITSFLGYLLHMTFIIAFLLKGKVNLLRVN